MVSTSDRVGESMNGLDDPKTAFEGIAAGCALWALVLVVGAIYENWETIVGFWT